MRILGIDPGTGILGFGIIEIEKNQPKLVDGGVIRTPVKEDDAVRLLTIYDELTSIIKQNKPDVMSVEKLFFARKCFQKYFPIPDFLYFLPKKFPFSKCLPPPKDFE